MFGLEFASHDVGSFGESGGGVEGSGSGDVLGAEMGGFSIENLAFVWHSHSGLSQTQLTGVDGTVVLAFAWSHIPAGGQFGVERRFLSSNALLVT